MVDIWRPTSLHAYCHSSAIYVLTWNHLDYENSTIGRFSAPCYIHELRTLRLACMQIFCTVLQINSELWNCLSARDRKSPSCQEFISDMYHNRNFVSPRHNACSPALLAPEKVSPLSSWGQHQDRACFAAKATLYNDIDELLTECLLDFSQSSALNKANGPDTWMSRCMHLMHTAGRMLARVAVFYGLERAAMTKRNRWPNFRLSSWCAESDRHVNALSRLVEMLYRRQALRRVSFVEVGVFDGGNAVELLTMTGNMTAEMHLVDPWDCNEEMLAAIAYKQMLQDNCNSLVERARDRMKAAPLTAVCHGNATYASAKARVRRSCCGMSTKGDCVSIYLHQATSMQALKRFPRDSLDLVFIDGSHRYADVFLDLNTWWNRVRPMGILAGHDLNEERQEVLDALLDFLAVKHITEVFLDADSTFWIRKQI